MSFKEVCLTEAYFRHVAYIHIVHVYKYEIKGLDIIITVQLLFRLKAHL